MKNAPLETDAIWREGLPANEDVERLILGSILADDSIFPNVVSALGANDFSMEKHRRIFLRMVDLNQRGQRIDRVTLAHELMNQKQLESVDGLTYLSQLDEGLPQIANLDSYVAIVSELSAKRKLLFTCNNAIQRVLTD